MRAACDRASVTRLGASLLVAATLAGCSIPVDPDGTLDRVRANEVLRVGATESTGWVEIVDEQPAGPEPEIAERFAAHLGAEVEWTTGSEQELIEDLGRGELDLVVGGFTDDSPWITEAGSSQPFAHQPDGDGGSTAHIMLVPLGENALLLELDRFLQAES